MNVKIITESDSVCNKKNQTRKRILEIVEKNKNFKGFGKFINYSTKETFIEEDITYDECLKIGEKYDYFLFFDPNNIVE